MLEYDEEMMDLSAQLRHFRATHTYKHLTVAGRDWQYLTGGDGCGRDVLLLLPGAPGLGEMAFQLIMRFERNYRVISPSYPAGVTTVAQLLDGIIAILDHEHVEVASIVGGSYSGMVAQCLVRRAPHRVAKLILDHTNAPSRARARTHRLYHTILKLLPSVGIRALFQLGNQLSTMGKTPEQLFWRSYFRHDVIARLTKEDYLSRIRVCIDFYEHYSFEPEELSFWPGALLIVESDNDSYVPAKERAVLRALYPSAQVFTFCGTGHGAWANQFETFFSIIARFLRSEEPDKRSS